MNFIDGKINIKFNLPRVLISLLLLLLFIIVSVYMWIKREDGTLNIDNPIIKPVLILVSYIGAPFMFLFLIAAVYPIILGKPALTIDKEGIIDYSGSWIGLGRIYWRDISSINLHRNKNGKKELHLHLLNSNEILSRYNHFKRPLMSGFHGFNNGIVGIQIEKLQMNPNELLSNIQQYYDNCKT